MLRKINNFINNNFNKILVIAIIICIISTVIYIIHDATRSIEDQKQKLHRLSQFIDEDIFCITELEDVEMYVREKSIGVTIYEKDCELKLIYDKDLNLESKVFNDKRVSSNVGIIFFAILVFGILIPLLVVYLSMIILIAILEAILENKQRKINKEVANMEETSKE